MLSFEVMLGTAEKFCTVPQLFLYPGALTKECISNPEMTLQKLKRPLRQQFAVPFNVLATMNGVLRIGQANKIQCKILLFQLQK